jgi:hypothetical protein
MTRKIKDLTLDRMKRSGEQITHFGGQGHHSTGLTAKGLEVLTLPL